MVVIWSKTKVSQFSWRLVQLKLPVGVRVIRIDAVSGLQSQSLHYVAVDDITIAAQDCPQPGNFRKICHDLPIEPEQETSYGSLPLSVR